MKEETLAVRNRFLLFLVGRGSNSFASSLEIALNTAIPTDKDAKQTKDNLF